MNDSCAVCWVGLDDEGRSRLHVPWYCDDWLRSPLIGILCTPARRALITRTVHQLPNHTRQGSIDAVVHYPPAIFSTRGPGGEDTGKEANVTTSTRKREWNLQADRQICDCDILNVRNGVGACDVFDVDVRVRHWGARYALLPKTEGTLEVPASHPTTTHLNTYHMHHVPNRNRDENKCQTTNSHYYRADSSLYLIAQAINSSIQHPVPYQPYKKYKHSTIPSPLLDDPSMTTRRKQ